MGRVLLGVIGASAVCLAVAGFLGLLPGMSQSSVEAEPRGQEGRTRSVDLGEPLYTPAKVRNIEPQTQALMGDLIIVAGQLNTPEQSEHASQVDGQISFIGEELPEWLPGVTGVAALLADPMNFRKFTVARLGKKESTADSSSTGETDVVEHEIFKFYRRLKESDKIREDQVLAVIDPTLALAEIERQRAKVMIAIAESVAADKTLNEARQRLDIARGLYARRPPAISAEDYRLAELTFAKSLQDLIVKKEGIRAARMEERQAQLKLDQHTIRSKLRGQYGVIKKILRQPGDAVKAQEPILQIVSMDPLDAEALVEVQLAGKLQPKRRVIVEPTEEIPPKHTFKAHTLEVTGVAVSNHPKDPFIVSGSEDRTVCVWVPGMEAPIAVLDHPAPVRSVVCSPRGAKHNYCLVGCDDGALHLWNLSAGNNGQFALLGSVPGDDGHKDSSVTALAFSPDGRWFASGGSDSRILIWDIDKVAGKGKEPEYAVESANGDNPHEGTITSLTLLPQAKLVSAARDKTLRVWSLHQKGAKLAYAPLADRSGLVPQVGASRDGRWMIFDPQKGAGLQLRSVETGRIVKNLQNPPGTIPFETLAAFSPDASLLLTAGAPEGRLQLWKAPTENSRGFEVRQLTTVERQSVTCAAFAPFADQPGAGSFAVTGTKDGNVYYWALPTQADIGNHRIEDAQISMVAQVLDQTRQVPIRIALRNPDGRLKPGRPVTIVIEP